MKKLRLLAATIEECLESEKCRSCSEGSNLLTTMEME
jgi:hypothetical protein